MTSSNTSNVWNSTSPISNHTQVQEENQLWEKNKNQEEFYKANYDVMTGIRIASTLGGFFLLVLLTLLYKYKCKKSSGISSPGTVPLNIALLPSFPLMSPPGIGDDGRGKPLHLNLNNLPMDRIVHMNYHNQLQSPAVLLTTANSESSDEDLLSHPYQFGVQPPRPLKSGHMNPLKLTPLLNPVQAKNPWTIQQNIDINVILPTPTISPSGSENILPRKKNGIEDIPIPLNHLGSDRDRSSSFGSEYSYSIASNWSGGGPTGAGHPIFCLDNLKYMDDTSSENIPTKGSDVDDGDQDSRSIGSDSVFAYFEHNFDHVAPMCGGHHADVTPLLGMSRRLSATPSAGGVTDDEECDCRLTLTQVQVHHRDSFASDIESVQDYLESRRRRSSSTQTTLSDLRHCLSLSSTGSSPNPVSRYTPGGIIPPPPPKHHSHHYHHRPHPYSQHFLGPMHMGTSSRRRSSGPTLQPQHMTTFNEQGCNGAHRNPSSGGNVISPLALNPALTTVFNNHRSKEEAVRKRHSLQTDELNGHQRRPPTDASDNRLAIGEPTKTPEPQPAAPLCEPDAFSLLSHSPTLQPASPH